MGTVLVLVEGQAVCQELYLPSMGKLILTEFVAPERSACERLTAPVRTQTDLCT